MGSLSISGAPEQAFQTLCCFPTLRDGFYRLTPIVQALSIPPCSPPIASRPPFDFAAFFNERATFMQKDSMIGEPWNVSDTRDFKSTGLHRFSRASTRSLAQTSSRLAHWPPPFRSTAAKPKIVRHTPDEKPQRAKPRGWRLTRAIFSEFEEE